jgi:TolB protein
VAPDFGLRGVAAAGAAFCMALAALAGALDGPPDAHATFPGPNGKIAFERSAPTTYDIFVMNADGSAQTNLTNHAANDIDAAWSPDGTKIAFTSDRDGNREIYVMTSTGGSPTRLTTNAAQDDPNAHAGHAPQG